MAVRVAVLGGSSPFTVSLIDALVEAAPDLPSLEISLFGRDMGRAALIAEHAQAKISRFGWSAQAAASLPDALRDAQIVVHQIRYGGLTGRRTDELLCARFGVRYDETLGAGALGSLLRTRLLIEPIASALAQYAKTAWIITLTNPLSAVTTLLAREYGLTRSLGVCELPAATAAAIAAQLGLRSGALSWDYSGLNHRGFIHGLKAGGEDVLPRFLASLGAAEFCGIPASEIAALRAVPLKYYRLLTDKTPAIPADRANELLNIGEAIANELRLAPHASPPSLARRDTSWYHDAVVPMMMALLGGSPADLVATLPDDGDIAWERKIVVEHATVRPCPSGAPPGGVEAILAPLVAHEKAVVAATRRPDRPRIAEVLSLDPLIPRHLVEPIAAALNTTYRERNHSER